MLQTQTALERHVSALYTNITLAAEVISEKAETAGIKSVRKYVPLLNEVVEAAHYLQASGLQVPYDGVAAAKVLAILGSRFFNLAVKMSGDKRFSEVQPMFQVVGYAVEHYAMLKESISLDPAAIDTAHLVRAVHIAGGLISRFDDFIYAARTARLVAEADGLVRHPNSSSLAPLPPTLKPNVAALYNEYSKLMSVVKSSEVKGRCPRWC